MGRIACGAGLLLLMAGVAGAQPPGGGGKGRPRGGARGGYADPSLIIAAELAYDRLAVEKGQWSALARIVAKDALLFRPAPVFAERWLKGQREPVAPLRWQTQQVFMACDGSSAVSRGTWTRPGGDAGTQAGNYGWFTNIWRRDKGVYRLVLNMDGPSTSAAVARDEDELEAMSARIAACPKRGRPGEPPPGANGDGGSAGGSSAPARLDPAQPLPQSREDRATDGTLRWRWSAGEAGGSPRLEAWMATDAGEEAILSGFSGESVSSTR